MLEGYIATWNGNSIPIDIRIGKLKQIRDEIHLITLA
jgi:hypothetical protein